MWTSVSKIGVKSVDKGVQTIIHVRPYVLDSNQLKAQVMSESKCQTEVTIAPDQEDKLFYSMLEYIPFQDIQESSVRVMNLPRKLRLQFSSGSKLRLNNYLQIDDDGINELCQELKQRALNRRNKPQKMYTDAETQT